MALALESAGRVRQKAYASTRNPFIFRCLQAFFLDWAVNHGNADLQFVPYSGSLVDDAGGEDTGIDAAHHVNVFYGKKPAVAEDVYLYFFDDATDDAGAATDGRGQLVFLGENGTSTTLPQDEAIAIYANSGVPMTAGLVVKAYTDFDGTTDSTAGASPNGFVIISA
jgi:hypothetical protein